MLSKKDPYHTSDHLSFRNFLKPKDNILHLSPLVGYLFN